MHSISSYNQFKKTRAVGAVLVTGSFSFEPTPRHRLLYATVRIFRDFKSWLMVQ